MATDNNIELARQHAHEQGYQLGLEEGAGQAISLLVESRDHPDDCECVPCGNRRWICGGASPGATLADSAPRCSG